MREPLYATGSGITLLTSIAIACVVTWGSGGIAYFVLGLTVFILLSPLLDGFWEGFTGRSKRNQLDQILKASEDERDAILEDVERQALRDIDPANTIPCDSCGHLMPIPDSLPSIGRCEGCGQMHTMSVPEN